ncbi:MAG TPA: YhbY family RNA-binding protein [Smithellaceae bacterium]|jgi:RNA-binding protein|nr:YhbY family RNA-binding protein [Smithellaceae bacterium]HQM46755.1 YhbY family RNA-binding protein [Smithellaceae bacterium]
MMMEALKGVQRRYLRAQAHHLRPLVLIGAKGLTESLLDSVRLVLKDHELIKIKFVEFKNAKKELSAEIAEATGSELIGIIGNVGIFYRKNEDPAQRKIKMP